MWIHSWNHTSARGVIHELGMSCFAKNNLSLSRALVSQRVTACLGTSHKRRLRRASLSRGDAVFRGVLRVSRAHVPSFLPKREIYYNRHGTTNAENSAPIVRPAEEGLVKTAT